MSNVDLDLFRHGPNLPPQKPALQHAGIMLREVDCDKTIAPPDRARHFRDSLMSLDQMGQLTKPAAVTVVRKIVSSDPDLVRGLLDLYAQSYHPSPDDNAIQDLIRVLFISQASDNLQALQHDYDAAEQRLQQAAAAAAAGGTAPGAGTAGPQPGPQPGAGGPPNPNIPTTADEWEVVDINTKSDEWRNRWNEAGSEWDKAKIALNLSEEDDPYSELDRFQAGWDIVHTVTSAGERPIRAYIDRLLSEIWSKPSRMDDFFGNKEFTERPASCFSTIEPYPEPTDLGDLPPVPSSLILPTRYRGLSLAPQAEIRRIFHNFSFALHPDRISNEPDISENLKSKHDLLFKQINNANDMIYNLPQS